MNKTIVYRKEVVFGTSMHERLGTKGLFERYNRLPQSLGGRMVEDHSNEATGKYYTVWEFDREEDAAVAAELISGADIFGTAHLREEKRFIIYWRDGKCEEMAGKTIAEAFIHAGYGGGALGAVDFYKEESVPSYEWNRISRTWVESDPVKEIQITRECFDVTSRTEDLGKLIMPLSPSDVVKAINEAGPKEPYKVDDFVDHPDVIECVGLYIFKTKTKAVKVWVVKGN